MLDREGLASVVGQDPSSDSLAWVHQTESGWTPPAILPSKFGVPESPRIALDTEGVQHVTWLESGQVFHAARLEDSWSTPEQLDTATNSSPPTICVDGWNQTHVFVNGDSGFWEKVQRDGRWVESNLVYSGDGAGEPDIFGGRLNLVFIRGGSGDVWYSYRELPRPGVSSPSGSGSVLVVDVSPRPLVLGEWVSFDLSRSVPVRVGIFNSLGSCVGCSDLGILTSGTHEFRPWGLLHGPGVYYCRLQAGSEAKTVKLIRAK